MPMPLHRCRVPRINRNIVECKFGKNVAVFHHTHVLIETLWNVNVFHRAWLHLHHCVLIETLWNVNSAGKGNIVDELSINRNIVECKYRIYSLH